jgi:hypothetical protein
MSAITILPESQLSEPNLDSPSAVQIELPNALQALGSLLHLVERERNDPDKVLQHVRMADGIIEKIANMTRGVVGWPKPNNTAQ